MHGVGVDRHGIGDAHDLRDGGGFRDHRRMHALLDPVRRAAGDAEQLDAIAEFGRGLDIGEADRFDALDGDGTRRRSTVPKASEVRMASLWAVSKPPMSKAGSASA